MHYHTEIILPPTDDIEGAIAAILAPFDENGDEEIITKPFWDFYQIGGRFAGRKLLAGLGQEKVNQFYDWLQSEKITVSGLTCGKQELVPATQIPKVDAKWNEMFPSDTFQPCPIFKHSNNQHNNETLSGDICELSKIPDLTCERVIFAGLDYKDEKLEAKFMLSEDIWNGVNHIPSKWNGKVKTALNMFKRKLKNYAKDYRKKVTPKDDWLVVTVDYHS